MIRASFNILVVLEFPPFTPRKNFDLTVSICWWIPSCSSNKLIMYIDILFKEVLVRIALPPEVRLFPFHGCNLCLILSTMPLNAPRQAFYH
jgi:hypothetical protein